MLEKLNFLEHVVSYVRVLTFRHVCMGHLSSRLFVLFMFSEKRQVMFSVKWFLLFLWPVWNTVIIGSLQCIVSRNIKDLGYVGFVRNNLNFYLSIHFKYRASTYSSYRIADSEYCIIYCHFNCHVAKSTGSLGIVIIWSWMYILHDCLVQSTKHLPKQSYVFGVLFF